MPDGCKEMSFGQRRLLAQFLNAAGSYSHSQVHLGLANLRGQTVAPYSYVVDTVVMLQSPGGIDTDSN
jgi:hypothetical protein